MKKIYFLPIIIIINIIFSISLFADELKPYDTTVNDYQFSFETGTPGIPYEPVHSLIFMQIQINGTGPLWFILDSGFEFSVIDSETAEQIGLKIGESEKVKQPGGEVDMAVVDDISISFPGLEVSDQKLAVIPLKGLEPIVGRTINGVLGHNLFERFVVEIDYYHSVVRFIDPDNYNYTGDGVKADVTVINSEPFVYGDIIMGEKKPIKAKLKLDTGSSDFVGFHGSFVQSANMLPVDHHRLSALGTAIGGHTDNYVTRLDKFHFGSLSFDSPVVGYSVDTLRGGDAGTIGGELFRRFNMIFNYTGGYIAFEKNRHFGDPYDYDMSGIFPISPDDDFEDIEILNVTPGSPADRAGFKAGDKILSIDEKPIRKINLIKFRKMMMIEDVEYKIEIERDGDDKTLNLKLQKLI